MTAEDGHGHDREHRSDVETAIALARIRYGAKRLVEGFNVGRVQGQNPVSVTVRALTTDLGQFGGPQDRRGILAQLPDPQLLRPIIGHVEVRTMTRIALGQAQRQPTGGLVAGPCVGFDVREGLGQQGLIAKALEPKPRQFPHGRPEDT